MSKFDPARLDAANYASHSAMETRFQDLDPLGHINNVALAGIFENGRVRFNHDILASQPPRDKGDRWLVARVEINYLAEAHFPDPIILANAIGHIGNRSWQIFSAAWQNGEVVGLCDTVLVYQSTAGHASIDASFRARLEELRFKG